jgi:hypothetical protein
MTAVTQTLTTLVSPFSTLIMGLKNAITRDPVPCWTEYLREQNQKQD